jgi:heavy metal sensor kinase
MRWRLQLWYAGVFLLVITSAGALVYWQARAAKLADIDTKLKSAANYLDAVLRSFPRGELDVGFRPPRPGGFRPDGPGPDGPPPRPGFRPDGPPGRPPPPFAAPPRRSREELFEELEIQSTFGPEEGNPLDRPFFLVWRADGSLMHTSDSALPKDQAAWPIPDGMAGEIHLVERGPQRLAIAHGPETSIIVVGKSAAREFNELRALVWQLSLGGLVALGLGLAGGWWVSARVLKPLAAISCSAAAISASNLSARIDTSAIDHELVELAGVLNETFARLQSEFERQVRFTADASHEIRTPLAVFYSNVELALARPRTTAEYRETLERCQQAAVRMRGLVDGLLMLARADAGRLDIACKPIDLRQLVEETADHFQPQAERAAIELTSDVAEEPVTAAVDPVLLGRVLENLTANALRHTPKGGSVMLRARVEKKRAVLEVSDTGEGIALEDQPRLFERFFRADKARSRASGGNGLGLAICKSLVEAHGGTIGFQSVPHEGTRFVVELPLAQEEKVLSEQPTTA